MDKDKDGNMFHEIYYVTNPEAVIIETAKLLGYKNITMTIGNKGNKVDTTADFNIRFLKDRSHYQVGDSNGKLLWDPYRWNSVPSDTTGTADQF